MWAGKVQVYLKVIIIIITIMLLIMIIHRGYRLGDMGHEFWSSVICHGSWEIGHESICSELSFSADEKVYKLV